MFTVIHASPSHNYFRTYTYINYAPRSTVIEVSPMGVVVEGVSVTMTCNSSGAPVVESYAWFKDRESGSIPDSFRPQLHLKRVSHTDRGEYFCVARNPLGTERSKPVLTVLLHGLEPTWTGQLLCFHPRHSL
uniref:Ig-like domain-containing protein n=1 Tax=Oncorhynchus kisutch TaxID=8019 RepID=A0A8C7C581_ONCKI